MKPGPQPKDPALRQRRNRASTAAELSLTEAKGRRVPPLNATLLGMKRGQGKVRPQVLAWWRDAWQSPMSGRWLATDVQVLYLCAQLRQQLQTYFEAGKPITTLAAEIARQEGRIGLDVMARRRLDWRIGTAQPVDPPSKTEEQQVAPPEPEGFDPRAVLRAVK